MTSLLVVVERLFNGATGTDTFKVTAGIVTINDLINEDHFVVSNSATATANNVGNYTAQAATSNAGTATINSATGNTTIDMSGSTSGGFKIVGSAGVNQLPVEKVMI